MSTDSTHTIQFCCGTSCDAQANLEYVKDLEARNVELEMELKARDRALRILTHKHADLLALHCDLNAMFTVMMRLHPLEIRHGLTKGDTQGAT